MVVTIFGDDAVLTLSRVHAASSSVPRRRQHIAIMRARRNPARITHGPGPKPADYAAFGARQATRAFDVRSRPEVAAHVIGRHVTVVALGDARDVPRLDAEDVVAVSVSGLRSAHRPIAGVPSELESVEVTHLEAPP